MYKPVIRTMNKEEHPLLEGFLYEAIFIPEGVNKPSRDIIYSDELQVYIKDFGKYDTDYALVAIIDNKIVGACWTRVMNDYGHVEDNVPSIAMSLYKEYRSKGIGTKLLNELLNILKVSGCKKVSLSVQKNNYAYKMYLKAGFETIKETDEEYIMVCNLN